MKKFFRSAIAIILAISMMPLCFAIEPEPQGGIEWAALPDNTVVCYLYGLPVYKSDVDENGFINCEEVLDRPMPLNYSSYYTEGAILLPIEITTISWRDRDDTRYTEQTSMKSLLTYGIIML